MGTLNTGAARTLGREVGARLERGDARGAFRLVEPLLTERIPFAMLDRVAREFGQASLEAQDGLLEQLARNGAIGSWPLIGTALVQQLDANLAGALERDRVLVMIGDVWYAADAVGERTAGTALVNRFEATLERFETWRADENRWVRRSIGVGVHVWAKRKKGAEPEKAGQILELLQPLWGEQEMDAVKGIGWGLKTLGRYYPTLMREWLDKRGTQPHRALMMNKARTYL